MFLFIILIFIGGPSAMASVLPAWKQGPQPETPLTAVTPHPFYPDKLMVSSHRHLYEETGPSHWKRLWSLNGKGVIRKLIYFPSLQKNIFILTSEGIWRGDLEAKRWERIYSGLHPLEKNALSFLVSPEDSDHWFAGTQSGLFETDDAGKTWFSFPLFRRDSISVLSFSGNRFFVGTQNRIYVSEDLNRFSPVFSLLSGDAEEFLEIEESFEEFASGEDSGAGTSVDFWDMKQNGQAAPSKLWLATAKGVFESSDGGLHWKNLSQSGLRSVEIRHLIFSANTRRLYAGSRRGVYVYRETERRWQELYKGLTDSFVFSLELLEGNPESLAVITRDGLSRIPLLPDSVKPAPVPDLEISNEKLVLGQNWLSLEPTAREVQEAALRYNNLKNGKIKRWQKESRLAALLPSFSFGRDASRANNIEVDRRGTTDPDQFIFGPDDTDKGWDIDLSWDFADFIWSSDQTSIDSREKLMVELRQDFLAEVTRIYYERRRLQIEIILAPRPSLTEQWEQLNRLEELTALLDAMTGGYLSQKIEAIYHGYPHTRGLWKASDFSSLSNLS